MEVGAGIDEGEEGEGGDVDEGEGGDEGEEGGNGSGEEGVELFNNVYSNNNDYDNDVKDVDGNEHRMYSVDEEGDDENMETRDFGFIYS